MADDRQDLLNAINSFLDCSIVLPPSEMGGDELLRSVARFQRDMLRKREEQEVKMLSKEPKSLKDKGEQRGANPAHPGCGKYSVLNYTLYLFLLLILSFILQLYKLQPVFAHVHADS